jgi:hypothetical protein
MKWLETALHVVVANYVMWATDYAACATGTEARSDYLIKKFFPLE